MQQNPTRDLQLDFNVKVIKQKIDAIVVASVGGYRTLDKNDILNTYRIAVVSGLLSGIISITLKKIDENKTDWKSEIMKTAGAKTEPAVLARFQDEFLGILSKALAGQPVTKELVSKNKSGCFGVLLLMILLTGFLSYYIFN